MNQFFRFSIFVLALFSAVHTFSQNKYEEDFLFLWNTLEDNYAYFEEKQTNWDTVKAIYFPKTQNIKDNYEFTLFLEKVLMELYDHHTNLNTNTDQSYRLVPSGTDLWGDYEEGKYLIKATFPGSKASAIVHPGDEVIAFNGQRIDQAVQAYIGKSFQEVNEEILSFAFRLLLAGSYREERTITVLRNEDKLNLRLGLAELPTDNAAGLLNSKIMADSIGYIKINNSLGNNQLIPAFDSILDAMLATQGLIIDLRNTPAGGNTTVARAIMGRFIQQELFYQKHVIPARTIPYGVKRSWVEMVSPRKTTYLKPVVILVNYWTGSMGEGIAAGFDGMNRATVVGTPMAGLAGAIYFTQLPQSNIGLNYSREQLFHIDGRPREEFQPPVLVRQQNKRDAILAAGHQEIIQQVNGKK